MPAVAVAPAMRVKSPVGRWELIHAVWPMPRRKQPAAIDQTARVKIARC